MKPFDLAICCEHPAQTRRGMVASASAPSPRSGYSLVELFVVVAILGTLLSLLLPAVQIAATQLVNEN